MKIIYLDGYNIINAWPSLNEIKKHSLEGSREKLIEIMQNYASYEACKVIIVFDSYLVKGSIENKEKTGNITVVYTKMGETADSYIERIVSAIGRKYEVTVVTSDLLEQQLIFQRGASRIPSMEFYQEVSRVNNNITSNIQESYGNNRNLIEEQIDKEVYKILDEIRKQK